MSGHTRQHGMSRTPEYVVWINMRNRCLNPANKSYRNYGGRGITVCDRWLVFENFLADMGKRPDGMTLERINNDGSYSPDNCRWATWAEQKRNQRCARVISFDGKTMCLKDWALSAGMHTHTLWYRLQRGWPFRDAITRPVSTNARTTKGL